ncbi:cAMP-responsive element-binding protein-like 2 isoform X2 [Lineus longissimus]|uniref:cAMP-responsive element-binding protein-like 2 isoform X2 n=1 Tax=Lineus longissimus TaxID=88925 RepID=UPI00315CC966
MSTSVQIEEAKDQVNTDDVKTQLSNVSQAGSGRVKKTGRRGRRPTKVDVKVKLERSRQSARECRARKKLRYQYVEELVTDRERAIHALRQELETCKKWCHKIDQGHIPSDVHRILLDAMEVPVSCCSGGNHGNEKHGGGSNG